MLCLYVATEGASGSGAVDLLIKLSELVAKQGVYALVVIFLFYLWRRTLADFTAASPQNHDYLRRVHHGVVIATYVLIAVAIPTWIITTFFSRPKTALWGSVTNLKRMAGEPSRPGTVYVDEQIAPQQHDVRFYTSLDVDKNDAGKMALNWALVQDEQSADIPMVFVHSTKEMINPELPANPNDAFVQPQLRALVVKRTFRIPFGMWAASRGTSFEYQHWSDPKDPDRNPGTIHLLRNGKDEEVSLKEFALRDPATEPSHPWPSVEQWLHPVRALAQSKADPGDWLVPLLGNSDVKVQLSAQQTLTRRNTLPWNAVRKTLANPQPATDRSALVHNLSEIVLYKGRTDVPSDVRLTLAQQAYEISDYKVATALFKGLSDKEISKDSTNLYFRGVSNLQVKNYDAASADLSTYLKTAQTPTAKAAANKALVLSNQKK